MKILLLSITMACIIACSNNDNTPGDGKPSGSNSTQTNASNSTSAEFPIQLIVRHYLDVKNALADDNSKEAASAGKKIVDAIVNIDNKNFTDNQKKIFAEVEEDAREHAEHIGNNASDIKHQREHFETLSKDVYDMVKAFPTDRTLYQVSCPKYNDNKSYWITEVKEIKNPYLGKEMPSCGEIKEEIKH